MPRWLPLVILLPSCLVLDRIKAASKGQSLEGAETNEQIEGDGTIDPDDMGGSNGTLMLPSGPSGSSGITGTSGAMGTTGGSGPTGASGNPVLANPANAPRVFFSDLTVVPRKGGPQDQGAFVTLYGLGFNTSGTVTIGGTAVFATPVWRGAAFARGLETIVIQVGNGAPTGQQSIVVTNVDGSSPPISVNVTDGANIFQIDAASGNDAIGRGARSYADPYQTFAKASADARPGDVYYARAGSHGGGLDIDEHVATFATPVAFVAYPGETVTLGGVTGHVVHIDANAASSGHVVVAGMSLHGSTEGAILVSNGSPRIVGNHIAQTCTAPLKFLMEVHQDGLFDGYSVLGNYIDGAGSECKNMIGLRPIPASGSLRGIDIGYNELVNARETGIRLATSSGSFALDEWHIHHNVIRGFPNGSAFGVNLQPRHAAGDADIYLYDNIIAQNNGSGLQLGVEQPTGSNVTVIIEHNTFYKNDPNCNGCSEQIKAFATNGSIILQNNIIESADGDYIGVDNSASLTAFASFKNVLAGGMGGVPSGAPATHIMDSPIYADPLTGDFRLLAGSVGLDSGETPLIATTDWYGRLRSTPDVGAIERF